MHEKNTFSIKTVEKAINCWNQWLPNVLYVCYVYFYFSWLFGICWWTQSQESFQTTITSVFVFIYIFYIVIIINYLYQILIFEIQNVGFRTHNISGGKYWLHM